MPNDAPGDTWPVLPVRLDPDLVRFLEECCAESGRALGSEVALLVGAATEDMARPPPPVQGAVTCRETLMAEKATSRVCGERALQEARAWAERHSQVTGHDVQVSLAYDDVDADWLSKPSPERRAELETVRDGEAGRVLASKLRSGLTH